MAGFVAFPLSPPGFDGDLPVSDQLWPSAGGAGGLHLTSCLSGAAEVRRERLIIFPKVK